MVSYAMRITNMFFSVSDSEILREEPMSYSQASFWFLQNYLEDPTAFNITFWVRVKGSIDASRLARAVEMVAQSHESLRTTFSTDGTEPHQRIMKTSGFHLTQQPVKSQAGFLEVFKSLERHIFDIENGDTIRLILCEESDNLFYFALGFHHILMDGTSTDVLFANLQQAYKDNAFPSTQLQYPTWAAKQRFYVESRESLEDRSYWSREFATTPPVLPLFPMPQQSSRKLLRRYHMFRASTNLGADMTARIKERCRSQKVSPAYFHLAVWKTLLFRFLETDDLCIGINDMNRIDARDAGKQTLVLFSRCPNSLGIPQLRYGY
jgi:hybrid polyketide synthase/nonribosomal peptide synthetase ACE1